jgi:EAL domain-containing protein (putative c-di-GMP-specific phosphodiesterase class I)/ActR/RegA family two-component response regulator
MSMALPHTVRFAAPKTAQGTVLLIEDDTHLARSLTRLMNGEGFQVVHVSSGAAAVDKMMNRSFDAVISDLNLPGASGVDVLNVVRAYDPDVPLVLMTGCPTVDTAIEACSLGVLEYLVKPTSREQLARVLGRARAARRSALERREADDQEASAGDVAKATAETVRPPRLDSDESSAASSSLALTLPAPEPAADGPIAAELFAMVQSNIDASAPFSEEEPESAVVLRAGPPPPLGARGPAGHDSPTLRATFERALSTLGVELEPIADAKSKKLLGFSTRMFSKEETLTTESALVVTAERLGRLEDLRRRVRDLGVKAFASAPQDALLFVDVHPTDLMDGDLYSPEPPLARIADRVVLQVRARGLAIEDLSARASVLRFVGFRLAIADLDGGQACLTQIADLAPEFVKIDARLIRGLDRSAGRRRLASALVSMCRTLDAVAIAEGVSTAEEREALLEAGCEIVQGPIAARHVPASRRPGLVAAGR